MILRVFDPVTTGISENTENEDRKYSYKTQAPQSESEGEGIVCTLRNKGECDGPYSYGRPQSRIFRNGRKPDGATPRGR